MKKNLKQILEQIDPDGAFFTEEAINSLSEAFEVRIREKITEAETKLLEKHEEELKAVDDDHAEVMRNLVEEMDVDVSRKMDIIIEKLNGKHAEEVETLIENINDDHARKIQFVIEKIDETHEEEKQALAEALDEKHTVKLEEAVDHVTTEFTQKISIMEKEYDDKLDGLVEFYENEHTKNMVVKVSDYLDRFVSDYKESGLGVDDKLKLEALEGIFESVREQLGVNGKPVFLKESTGTDKIDELMQENNRLNSQIQKMEVKQLLVEKTETMSLDQADYIRKHFVNSSVEEINESLNEVVKAYKINKQADLHNLSDEYGSNGVKVNIPSEEPINEDSSMLIENQVNDEANEVSHYVDLVKKVSSKSINNCN